MPADVYMVDYDIVDSNGNIFEVRDEVCYARIQRYHDAAKAGFMKPKHMYGRSTGDIAYVRCYLERNIIEQENEGCATYCLGDDWQKYRVEVHNKYIQMLNSAAWLRPYININLKEQYVDLSGDIERNLAISALHLIRASAEFPYVALGAVLLADLGVAKSHALCAATLASCQQYGKVAFDREWDNGHCHGTRDGLHRGTLALYDGSKPVDTGENDTLRWCCYGNSNKYIRVKGDKLPPAAMRRKKLTQEATKLAGKYSASVDIDQLVELASQLLRVGK